MARPRSALVCWSQYFALRGISALMHAFPVEQNLHTAAVLGSMIHRTNRERRRRAEQNIEFSFPDWPKKRVREVAERSFQHMLQMFMVDSMAVPRLVGPASWPRYIELRNIAPVLDRLVRGEPMIFLTGHCGNWEIFSHFLALLGYPLVALARPLDNPLVNDWLMGIREARGTTIVTKWGATPILQETLERGGRLGFIADQNAGEQGLFVPFFGRLASSYKSIGLLAMRYNVPIVAGHAKRIDGRFQYELSTADVIEPEEWADQPDPLFYITARYNRAMEMMVRAAPDQYLWVHRRWKSRPKFETEGRPIPSKMMAKLESLPWMTTEALQRIVKSSNQN
ncbi:MAG TPA: lysophospholipid acyltransferase family protein [Phycisphaerales bacterium]|nr:lysophospholipid acyltransferase family protein [Phycisphaerales bacterium]HRQ74826.1 lysophospholipid acyltransferase family protein [Phycisphaerales bacterium]